MLYLLDANVFITAERDYYSLDRVPEFWDWLLHMSKTGRIKTPAEIYDEVVAGKGELTDWIKANRETLVLDESVPALQLATVIDQGYASDLNDEEIEKMGNDPFLIAYALFDAMNRTVVTTEHSKPTRTRGNRHIPDVCNDLGVSCVNTFELIRRLNFSTDWRSAL